MTDATATLEQAEAAVAEMVGHAFAGVATAAPPELLLGEEHFEFDPDFQTNITTHCVRDLDFLRKVGHLIKPEYFENVGEAALVNIALRFYNKYRSVPNAVTAKQLMKEDIDAKVIRSDMIPVVKDAFKAVYGSGVDLSNGDSFAEKVATFAKHQAFQQTILNSVDWLGKKQFDKIEVAMKAAGNVGINDGGEEYDYWESIKERSTLRRETKLGLNPALKGITTGNGKLDDLLYHKGWGRKELYAILGGPKAGKTTALIGFARAASLAGYSVLYATCEVSTGILSDRFDASISDTEIKAMLNHINEIEGKIVAFAPRAGALKIHEYPSGTLTPAQLHAVIERYKSPMIKSDGTVRPAIQFDIVVVDYADIMAPDHRTNDPIENSKSVYLGLRAIATRENVAMLTATQGNRDGVKSTVMKMEHVADDFNKVRTVDLMISINITDEERANGEARLFFAASRNQEGGFTVFIKQNLAKMKFIESIIRVE
jgi:replicative DNA helicase